MQREDHPGACGLWGELSTESILSHPSKCHQVQQIGVCCTERRQTSWESVSLALVPSLDMIMMVEEGHPVTRMDFVTMGMKSVLLGPDPPAVEREVRYLSGYRDTRAIKIARVYSP